MQKGLGIAALVLAILSMFIPFLGTWLTLLAGLLAAFAYGPGIGLAIASIILNIFHIMFLSPLLWATQALAEVGAAAGEVDIVFVPWLLVIAQIGAGVLLYMMHSKNMTSVVPA